MCCGGCETTVQTVLNKMDGIVGSNADVTQKTVTFEFESTPPEHDELKAAIASVGYKVVD